MTAAPRAGGAVESLGTRPARAAGPRVAFQGELGAYSDDAGAAWGRAAGGGPPVSVPARECDDVVAAVTSGAVDYGVLAVENTLAGAVAPAYDALAAAADVCVVGEVVRPIHHCVLAPEGATLDAITTLESHPVALAQCRRFLADHPWITPRPAYDTAGAARNVAASGDPRRAALAGRGAAERYGLAVLGEGVEDRADNQTRFLVVARAGGPEAARAAVPNGAPARTALLAEPDDAPGALLRMLAPLAAPGLDLRTLTPRPTGAPWRARYVLEVAHAAGDARLDAALDAVRRASHHVRVLGTFAAAGTDRW